MEFLNKLLCFVYGHRYTNVYTNKSHSKEIQKIKDECKICGSIRITTHIRFRGDKTTTVNYFDKPKTENKNE